MRMVMRKSYTFALANIQPLLFVRPLLTWQQGLKVRTDQAEASKISVSSSLNGCTTHHSRNLLTFRAYHHYPDFALWCSKCSTFLRPLQHLEEGTHSRL